MSLGKRGGFSGREVSRYEKRWRVNCHHRARLEINRKPVTYPLDLVILYSGAGVMSPASEVMRRKHGSQYVVKWYSRQNITQQQSALPPARMAFRGLPKKLAAAVIALIKYVFPSIHVK